MRIFRSDILKRAVDKYKSLPVQAKASFWFLICAFLQRGISMITTPIFTRLLSTEDYGQIGVFNSWSGIITVIVSLQLSYGVYTQGLIKFNNERKIYTSSLLGLTTSLITIWLCIYMLFRNFWNGLFSLTTVQMLTMFIMIWTTSAFNFWAHEQRVYYYYKALVIVTIIVSIAKPALGILMVTHSDDKVTARILGLALVELVCYSWMYIYQMRRGRKFFSKKFWIYAIGFNMPLVPHYLSQTVLNSADRIMIQRMVGDSEAGIYNLAYSLSSIMVIFNTALSQTISPWMYQKIKDRKEKDIAPIAYITLLLIAAVNLILILLAPEVISIFAPITYHEAIWVIPPVAMSVYFMYAYDLFAKFAFYYEKTRIIMEASVFGALLNITLNYFFIQRYGYIAAGYTTLVCFMVHSIIHYIFMKKVCQEYCEGECPYDTKNIIVITFLFLITGFVFMVTYNYPFIRYGLVAVAIIAAFLIRKKIIKTIENIINLKKQNTLKL